MMLNDAVSIGDLLNSGAKFEINSDFNDVENDEFAEFLFTAEDETTTEIKSPWEKSFDELKQLMKEEFDGIYKNIIKEGQGEVIPVNTRAVIHYNAFWENEVETFDSTYLRNKPQVFNIENTHEVLPGIERAVLSMKKGEEAQFLIPYQLLFGDMGCPPRIKPKADGLFIITLVNFSLLGDSEAMEKVKPEDRNNYSIIKKSIQEIRLSAIDHFKQGRYRNACTSFHKAVKSLEFCNVKNLDEQKEQQECLIKLYTNLAVCYNKLNMPAKACSMCNELSRLTNIRTNCKALFQEGRAYFQLSDFTRARQKLTLALSLEPNNEEIRKELQLLAEKSQKYDEEHKEICRRALGSISIRENEQTNAEEVSPHFKDAVKDIFEQMSKEDLKFFTIPDGSSVKEMEYLKEEAEKYDMFVEVAEKHNQTDYILKRKAETEGNK